MKQKKIKGSTTCFIFVIYEIKNGRKKKSNQNKPKNNFND